MHLIISQANDAEHRDCIRSIVPWLDELFSRQCVFADTIETISLYIPYYPKHCLDWTAEDNASFANELFQDHMLKHWHFPFPALQSFAMMWRINHCMKSLMVRRLVNCTKLHSIKLGLWKNESAMQYQMMNIKNRPEVIRQIRGRY